MTTIWLTCLLVGIGGALGALTRYGVMQMPWLEDNKYFYTVWINVTGCFLIGVLWALFTHWGWPKWVFSLCLTGYLGGYTTYSAFTLDAMQLLEVGKFEEMILYICITLFGGLGACAIGYFGTKYCCHMLNSF